jgi:hypothetical protein
MAISKFTPGYWSAKLSAAAMGWLMAALVITCIALTVWGLKRKVVVQHQVIRETLGQKAADSVWRTGTRAIQEIKAEQDAKEEAALREYPEFAESDVPDDVADILRDPDSKAKR